MAKYKLNDIAPIQQGTVATSDEYWLLNLDMVESNSGKVLGYNYVSPDQIGASTVSFDTGNVLYSKLRPYLNKVVLPKQSGYATSEMVPLRPNTDIITCEYLTYLLRSPKFVTYINSKTSGAKMPRAKMDALKKYEIDCPSISEQILRTARLDEIVVAAEICQQEIDNHDLLLRARFAEMFGEGYAEDTLLNLCTIIDYRGKTPEKVESGLPFITAKNVKMHHMNMEPREYISQETYDKVMTRGFPKEGDVVFTTEAPLGNVCRIPHFDSDFYIGQRIVTLQTDLLEPAYLEYAVSTDTFKKKYLGKASGSTVTGIKVRLLEQLTIPVPPRNIQKQFADYVDQVADSCFIVQSILDKLNTLQASLMQEYFG